MFNFFKKHETKITFLSTGLSNEEKVLIKNFISSYKIDYQQVLMINYANFTRSLEKSLIHNAPLFEDCILTYQFNGTEFIFHISRLFNSSKYIPY